MSELRYNVATREWVLIAPERSRRPEDFHPPDRPLTAEKPLYRGDCPFCPGAEDHTPDETLRYLDDQGSWQVRAFPNRYPALVPGARETEKGDLFHRRRTGHGIHEVVAESPLHNVTLALQPRETVAQVIRAWRERQQKIYANHDIEHVVVFKNHGAGAGTSLEHPHSQVIGLPVMPAPVRARMDTAHRYLEKRSRCVFCDILQSELQDGERVVAENPSFVAYIPFAAYSPFSLMLVPRRHDHCFSHITDPEIEAMAYLLQDVLARLYHGLRDPDYNLVVRSAAPPGPGTHFFHWYVALVPRLTKMAGFEMGTGMFINPSSPEQDAAFLRGVQFRDLSGALG